MKILSAEVVCCTYLTTLYVYVSIQANSVDPDQTRPIGADWSWSILFVEKASKTSSCKQKTKTNNFCCDWRLRVELCSVITWISWVWNANELWFLPLQVIGMKSSAHLTMFLQIIYGLVTIPLALGTYTLFLTDKLVYVIHQSVITNIHSSPCPLFFGTSYSSTR